MKKTLFMIAFLVAVIAEAQTARMVEQFATMPDTVLPLLSSNNRRDMVDFLSNGMEARVRNLLNEESTLRIVTETYLLLEMSCCSRVEMKMLQTADSVNIVALVRTVMGFSADSYVEFYDSEWHQLEWLTFPQPDISDFFSHVPDSVFSLVRQAQHSLADLRFTEVRPSPDEPVFQITLSVNELEQKERDAASPLVHPLSYLWDGETFHKME